MKFLHAGFRHTAPGRDPLGMEGSLAYGGRWNQKGVFGAIYIALSKTVLKAEIVRRMNSTRITASVYFPRKIAEVWIALSRVVDLRQPGECKKWGITSSDLVRDDWRSCQKAAKKIRDAGYKGVIYPSCTGRGDNIAVFTDRLRKDSSVTVARTWTAPTLAALD